MNSFDFTPAKTDAPFRDVSEVLESLEQAKTANDRVVIVKKRHHHRDNVVIHEGRRSGATVGVSVR